MKGDVRVVWERYRILRATVDQKLDVEVKTVRGETTSDIRLGCPEKSREFVEFTERCDLRHTIVGDGSYNKTVLKRAD